jgi:predicted XRE-type DNA-binding protein
MTKDEQEAALHASKLDLREVQVKLAQESGRMAWLVSSHCRRRLGMLDDVLKYLTDQKAKDELAFIRAKLVSQLRRMVTEALAKREEVNRALGVVFDSGALLELAKSSETEEGFLAAMLGLISFTEPTMAPEEAMALHLGVKLLPGGDA